MTPPPDGSVRGAVPRLRILNGHGYRDAFASKPASRADTAVPGQAREGLPGQPSAAIRPPRQGGAARALGGQRHVQGEIVTTRANNEPAIAPFRRDLHEPAPGEQAVVAVPVATMWESPDAVRAVDAPAVAAMPDVRRWVAGMSTDELKDLGGRTATQLLLGEPVLVEEITDGWARVIATEQPAGKLDPRGYPGWVLLEHLTAEPQVPAKRQVVVDATATALCDEPNGDVVLAGVVIGTRLPVVAAGARGWLPVAVPAIADTLWVRESDAAPLPTSKPGAKDLLAVAERLVDVPYVWGGLSAYGIDCSGLVHLAHRRLGVTVPRDADDQAQAGETVPLGSEQPGDLYFFARQGRPPHHIGIVTVAASGSTDDPRRLLHASGQDAAGRVVSEEMSADRSDTLVEARRTLS